MGIYVEPIPVLLLCPYRAGSMSNALSHLAFKRWLEKPINERLNRIGLTHQVRNVGAIHELPLREIKAFTAFLRKSYRRLIIRTYAKTLSNSYSFSTRRSENVYFSSRHFVNASSLRDALRSLLLRRSMRFVFLLPVRKS